MLNRWLAALLLIIGIGTRARAQQPDSTITRLLDQGYLMRRAGHPDSAARLFALALARDSTDVRVARELGFAQIAAGDTASARDTFRRVVALAPGVRDDQAQLGYLELAMHDLRGAIRAFQRATRIAPDDATLWLQLAYAYESARMHAAALGAFRKADQTGDLAVRRQARASLGVLAGEGYAQRGAFLADWYGDAQYGTHFNDLIMSAQGHMAVALDALTRTQAYVVAHGIRDARTRGGVRPIIFSDNYATAGIGLRSEPLPVGITLYAEAGPATALTNGGKSGLEWRGGLTYGSAWKFGRDSWFGDSYADASYYSRYEEAIGYAQFRQMRPIRVAPSWLDASLREELVADSKGVGYDNLAEAAAGVRMHGGPRGAGVLYLEYVGNVYTRSPVAGRREFGELRATFAASGATSMLPP